LGVKVSVRSGPEGVLSVMTVQRDGVPRVEFRLLGSPEVRVGGRVVVMRGGRARAVLAVLLLHSNHIVTVSQLCRGVWAEPPRAFGSNLRTYVAQLRTAFVGAGLPPSRLVTQSAGYQLTVDPGELDVARFEELAEDGQRALVRGDPVAAMGTLQQALDLWRGEPLAGLATGPLLDAQVMRLDERRIAVVQRWAEAAMAAGRADRAALELAPWFGPTRYANTCGQA
jgi:DNA-binding SARP family transcriptional activator